LLKKVKNRHHGVESKGPSCREELCNLLFKGRPLSGTRIKVGGGVGMKAAFRTESEIAAVQSREGRKGR